ncbi:hypothetical protein R1A27_32955 (plasmid) [Methylobacterium sp. NMS12]|uniref:hypothetical protein n=1 Tax=Methylobacterium sp. NMS12 TaxID=3079766 RepID=UPI003F884AC5
MRRAIGRLGLLQIDSVNVLVAAHYMPLFSRYDPDFSIDLSRCRIEADALLERWHARRVAVLDDTRATLKRLWREHQEVASIP